MAGKYKRARAVFRLPHPILATKGALLDIEPEQTEFRRFYTLLAILHEQAWQGLGG